MNYNSLKIGDYRKLLYLYSVEIQINTNNNAMITENKVIEIFCMADDFCKFFDTMMTKYTLPSTTKRKYH